MPLDAGASKGASNHHKDRKGERQWQENPKFNSTTTSPGGTSKNGNPTKTDTIRQAFETLRKKVDSSKPFKVFRKTGADMIEEQYPETPWLASQYLAHSEGGIKKHYVQKHYDLLFEALAWLESQFTLKTEGK